MSVLTSVDAGAAIGDSRLHRQMVLVLLLVVRVVLDVVAPAVHGAAINVCQCWCCYCWSWLAIVELVDGVQVVLMVVCNVRISRR